jgi:sugar phosphate isomerase/epimerase
MELSFHPSLGGNTPLAWPDSLRVASEAGFKVVDLDLERLDGQTPGEVRRELDEAGMRAGACPLPVEMREDEATFQTGLEQFEELTAAAAAIGIRAMHRSIPASSDRLPAEFTPVLQRRWSACAEIARGYGVALAVEPLGTLYRRRSGRHELIWRLEDGADFARSCGPGVGLLVDSWHWHLAESTAEEIVEAGDLVIHVHVADVPDLPPEAQRDTERLLPGEGQQVNFEAFLGALATLGYDGTVSPEAPGRWSDGSSPLEAARRGFAAAQKVLGTDEI